MARLRPRFNGPSSGYTTSTASCRLARTGPGGTYEQAIRLIRDGEPRDEVRRRCGLTAAELDLLFSLHGAGTAGGSASAPHGSGSAPGGWVAAVAIGRSNPAEPEHEGQNFGHGHVELFRDLAAQWNLRQGLAQCRILVQRDTVFLRSPEDGLGGNTGSARRDPRRMLAIPFQRHGPGWAIRGALSLFPCRGVRSPGHASSSNMGR